MVAGKKCAEIRLQVAERISAGIQNVPFHIHPESKDHVNNDGRSKGQERNIHEPHANAGSGDPHFFSNGGKNAESLPLNKIFKPVHTPKLIFFSYSINILNGYLNLFLSNFAPLFKGVQI
jgi:hypothetical protein